MNYPTLLALTRSLRVGLPASVTRFAGTTVVPERSFHSRFFGVTHSSCLDGVVRWDSARFVSRLNGVRIRNAHLTLQLSVQY